MTWSGMIVNNYWDTGEHSLRNVNVLLIDINYLSLYFREQIGTNAVYFISGEAVPEQLSDRVATYFKWPQ